MSFRVWFLRMVWIVAAAVALSGCDDDNGDDNENGNGTDPNGDGPTLAVVVTPATVEMGSTAADAGKHKVKVTITSDDDAHKTAKVSLAVECTGDVETDPKAPADVDAKNGEASWDVTVPVADKTVCTYTASALEKTATGTFTVGEAAAPSTPALTVTLHKNGASDAIGDAFGASDKAAKGDKIHVKVMKAGSVTADALNLKWGCKASDGTDAIASADVSGATFAASDDGAYFSHLHEIADSENKLAANTDYTCTAEVSATGATPGSKDLTVTGA